MLMECMNTNEMMCDDMQFSIESRSQLLPNIEQQATINYPALNLQLLANK